ncbi:MAG: phospholipase D-like domain-containing protein [Isosphaeraceae bacterium]|jgi:phosphatidylserine/phosphatidylglycerophosphate/cardiolipin synthase-like enzyme
MYRKRGNFSLTCETLEERQFLSANISAFPAAEVRAVARAGPLDKAPSLFIEPQAGRAPIIRAINAARSEIRLGICNLSDPQIGDALAAAVARGVNVEVIADHDDYYNKPDEQAELATLIGEGVSVHLSNSVFPQSFEKELVIDQRQVLIMTMCLIPMTFVDSRDYGLVLNNPGVIHEVTSVFDTDWAYSAPPGVATPAYNPTPALHAPNLIWGPADATSKLSQLIQSAHHTINITSELLGDPYLEGQLIAAAHRGVQVRLITPLNPIGAPTNAADIAFLTSEGVNVCVTVDQYPPPGTLPYMHAKTMIVDGRIAYLGSIDLVTAERSQDRELGIEFRLPTLVRQLNAQFQSDWSMAAAPPA